MNYRFGRTYTIYSYWYTWLSRWLSGSLYLIKHFWQHKFNQNLIFFSLNRERKRELQRLQESLEFNISFRDNNVGRVSTMCLTFKSLGLLNELAMLLSDVFPFNLSLFFNTSIKYPISSLLHRHVKVIQKDYDACIGTLILSFLYKRYYFLSMDEIRSSQ